MLAQIETVAIPALPAVLASKEYFEGAEISLMNENLRRLLLDMDVPEAPPADIQAIPLDREEWAGKALEHIKVPSLSQYCRFLSLKKGVEERFVTRLQGKDGRFYLTSGIWAADMTGEPFWEVVCSPLMHAERLSKGVMVVSLK